MKQTNNIYLPLWTMYVTLDYLNDTNLVPEEAKKNKKW